VEPLVEIDHELHVIADGAPHRVDGRQVVLETIAAQAQLQSLEPASATSLAASSASAATSISHRPLLLYAGRAERAAQKHGEGHVGRLGERVPRGHVQPATAIIVTPS